MVGADWTMHRFIYEIDSFLWNYEYEIVAAVFIGVVALLLYKLFIRKAPFSKGAGTLIGIVVFLAIAGATLTEYFLLPYWGLDVSTVITAVIMAILIRSLLIMGKDRRAGGDREERQYRRENKTSGSLSGLRKQIQDAVLDASKNPAVREHMHGHSKKSAAKTESIYAASASRAESRKVSMVNSAGANSADNWSGYTFNCPQCGATLLNRSKFCFKCGKVFYR